MKINFFSNCKENLLLYKNTIKNHFIEVYARLKDIKNNNYKVALLHLKKGKLWDASIRFRLLYKFYPEFHDAYYQYCYCLLVMGMYESAKRNLHIIVDYIEDANYLISMIERGEGDKIRDQYLNSVELYNQNEISK